jgi:CIC family chloride channel protein
VERGGFFQRFVAVRHFTRLLARANLRVGDAFYMNLLAVIAGFLVALFVYLFKGFVNWGCQLIRGKEELFSLYSSLEALLRGDQGGTQLGIFSEYRWLIYLLPPIGGLLVGFIFRFWDPHRRFRGVSIVMESVARRGGRLSMRKGFIEMATSSLSIISGLSVGVEGPIVVGGGWIGSQVAQLFRLSAARVRVLLACGSAAGISAVFNAPIAGFFFSLELILGDFRKKAVAAIVLASASANITIQALTGGEPIFKLPVYTMGTWSEILNYVVLGLICGLVAYTFAQVLQFCDDTFPRWRIYPPLRPMFGGIIISALAFFFPEILGTGHHVVELLVNGHFPPEAHLVHQLTWSVPILYLLALCFAKLVATSVTLGSGAAGGKFAPSLFMGSTIGGVFGFIATSLAWNPATDPAAYALVGMATIFGSIAQAPLTVILLVFEMTGSYTMILPMLAAGVLSQVVFYSLRKEGVFTHKLSLMGIKFGRGKDLNILEAIPVSRVMHSGVETIPASEHLGRVRERFGHSPHHGFPVVDADGRLCGMITTSDLTHHHDDPETVFAREVCTPTVYSLNVKDDCHRAIAMLEDYHIGRVPVLDDEGRPVGIITRTDIVGAYKLALQLRQQELDEGG